MSGTQAEAAVMAQVSAKFEDTGASLSGSLTALLAASRMMRGVAKMLMEKKVMPLELPKMRV